MLSERFLLHGLCHSHSKERQILLSLLNVFQCVLLFESIQILHERIRGETWKILINHLIILQLRHNCCWTTQYVVSQHAVLTQNNTVPKKKQFEKLLSELILLACNIRTLLAGRKEGRGRKEHPTYYVTVRIWLTHHDANTVKSWREFLQTQWKPWP